MWKAPAMPPNASSAAIIKFNEDGSVNVSVSGMELGQGYLTVMAQIAAEVLSVPPSRIRVETPDTDRSAYEWQTVGSHVTWGCGNAVKQAAEEARDRIFDLIERALDLVAGAPEPALDGVLWWFELSLAAALGYGPHLERCVVCGKEPTGTGAFVPAQGGIVCESCAVGQGPLSDAARQAARLLSGLVPQEAAPASRTSERQEPLPAGLSASVEVAPGVRDEVTTLLLAFLEEHAGRRLRLKSMDFLAQIRRTGPRFREPA